MKVKYLAAAIAGLTAAAASQAALTVAADHVIYIGGASAQRAAVNKILTVDSSFFKPGTVVGPFNAAGVLPSSTGNQVAYYGIYNDPVVANQVPTLVIYNYQNGSAAGINQLLSVGTGEAESTLGIDPSLCSFTDAASTNITCTGTVSREIDMALSDVYANEFGSSGALCTANNSPYTSCVGASYITLNDIKSPITAKSTGLEGFGVIVNANLYNDLLAQNIAEGLLPASCSTATAVATTAAGAASADCQPSIRSRDYAAIAAKGSGWDSFVLTGQTKPLIVQRRDDFSGTQAASNIFFLNNVCGSVGFKGALVPARAADSVTNLTFVENASGGNVETVVGSTTTGYAMGVVSIADPDHQADNTKLYYYVKIDGMSPNVYNHAYDATRSKTLKNGTYTFATEMAAYVRKTISGFPAASTSLLITQMASSTAAPTGGLNGIAYIDNSLSWPDAAGLQAKFVRGGNNCSPLH